MSEHTPGPWHRIALGGASTVVAATMPARNDNRIPGYGYKDEEFCLAYPFIEDGGRTRLDFVCFSHADAALIAAATDMLEALRTTAGNIRSLGPAGALDQVPTPYREWLAVVEAAIAKATGQAGG